MKQLGFQMGVPAQHFPIFMTSDERDLLNRKSCFKQTTCSLVAQVMKM
jgi:hypothetical protein